MNTSLGLRGRHALHTMDAGLPLHLGIDRISLHLQNDILVSPVISLRFVHNGGLPSLRLDKLAVHIEQISGEYAGLRPTGAGPDLQHDVAIVVGVLGQEEDGDPRLQFVHLGLDLLDLLPGHLLHVGVVAGILEQLRGTLQFLRKMTVLLEGQHDLLALGPVGHDLPQQVGIANDVRVGQPLRQGVVRPADAVEPLHHLLVDGTELGSGGGGGGGGCAAVRY
mmetsp:Transcript_11101/g.31217  ORF Transcript_11101/g.31217 Transcript_11101/m.31217 type:complete len:222 (+) Transcript_11101:1368-2033(+)